MKVIIAAGGTGGHLYPGISLARELQKRNDEILFIVRKNDPTIKILEREKLSFKEIPCAPFFGQSIVSIPKGIIRNISGIFASLRFFKEFRPDAVAGFGAYVSVPVILAAFFKRIPITLHEQNAVPGWATRFCAYFARKVAISFPESEKYLGEKSFLTGNLVRREFFGLDRTQAKKILGLKENRITVLVFGGSGGAKSINQVMWQTLDKLSDLRDKVQFIHLTGHRDDTEKLTEKYQRSGIHAIVSDYSHQMSLCYAASDFAVCRSGASTLFELVATRTPAIFIPYPFAIGDHQKSNAEILVKLGAAMMILKSEGIDRVTDFVTKNIRDLILSMEKLKQMREALDRFPIQLEKSAVILADEIHRSAIEK